MSKEDAGRKLGWAFVFVFLLASAEFLQRGPIRFARADNFNDFLSPYVQTTAWMKNMDPYSPRNMVALWPRGAAQFRFLKTDLADGSLVPKRGIPTAYPPASFVLLAPIAWLPWRVADRVWLGISLLAFGTTLWSLIALADFHWQQKRTYLFLALALALAPFQSGLAVGSIVIVAVGLCALAVWSVDRKWNVAAGVLLGIAIGLKPQIGLPFLFYYLLSRRWRVAATSVTVLAILMATAVLHLTMNHAPWLDYYRYDNSTLFARGSLGDFTESNPLRFGLINLQVLLYTFIPSRAGANIAALALTGVLGLLWLLLLRRRTERKHELLNLSALAVLSLLPVYHRFYDASLLIFPLAWSLAALPGSRSKLEKGTLLLILVFLVPGGSALEQLQRTGYLVALRDSWWWNHILMPHQVWTLLLISVLLLLAMRARGLSSGRTA